MGFEGNVRCALEHNQQVGQESGSKYISASGRIVKIYRFEL